MSLIYFTGMQAEIVGFLQRIILSTGVFQPEKIEQNLQVDANYDFELVDTNGQFVNFQNFKGQTVFLNFWATWCPPCVAEMPDIQSLYESGQVKNVAFILVSQDNDFEKAKSFVNRKGYTLPIYQLASRLPQEYASRSIPATFVISPEGKIIARQIGMAKYDTDTFRSLLTSGTPAP